MDAKIPRLAIYARQSVEEPQGISQQLDDCRAEAQRRGWTVVDEFADDDTSGSSERGPKTRWRAMLQAYDTGLIDTVLANDVDRLTRSLVDVLELRPPRRDMRVLTVRGGIDTLHDDTTFKMLVVMAEREVRLKTLRARRYAVERRKAGHPPAGRTAYGYRWVRKDDRDGAGTRFVIDETEAGIVRRIFEEFLATGEHSLGQIARDLNADGLKTREGHRWHTPTLRRILINPHYAALLPPAQPRGQSDQAKVDLADCKPGAWEPIIDLDQLVAARGLLVGRTPKHKGTARSHLLSGIPTCGVCGGPVRSARARTHPTRRKDGTRAPAVHHAVYRCVEGHFVRKAEMIDRAIESLVVKRLSKSDANALIRRNDGPDIAVLSARRTELQERDGAIASLLARGKLSASAAEEALDELATEIAEVDRQLASVAARDPLADIVSSGDAQAWWDRASLARRRAVIEELMEIVIHPIGNGRRVTDPDQVVETVDIVWARG